MLKIKPQSSEGIALKGWVEVSGISRFTPICNKKKYLKYQSNLFTPAFTKCSQIEIICILYSWQTSKKPEVVTKAQSNFLMQSCSNKDKVETSRHYLERYYEINILRLLKLDDIKS